jgi:hypothetical protein
VFVSQEHLSAWREQMGVLTISLSRIQSHLMVGKPKRAQHLLDLLHAATIHMGIALESAGAPRPGQGLDSLKETPDVLLGSGANGVSSRRCTRRSRLRRRWTRSGTGESAT